MPDNLVIAIVTLALVVGVTLLWWISVYRGIKRAMDGRISAIWGSLPLQISALTLGAFTLRAGPLGGMLATLSPPVAGAMALFFDTPASLAPLISASLTSSLPIAFAAIALCLLIRPLRWVWLCIAAIAAATTFLITSDSIIEETMCARAADAGLTNVTRHSLFWSIRNTGFEVQFDLHAMASLGEDDYGWSYSEMDWYLIPENTFADAPRTTPSCS